MVSFGRNRKCVKWKISNANCRDGERGIWNKQRRPCWVELNVASPKLIPLFCLNSKRPSRYFSVLCILLGWQWASRSAQESRARINPSESSKAAKKRRARSRHQASSRAQRGTARKRRVRAPRSPPLHHRTRPERSRTSRVWAPLRRLTTSTTSSAPACDLRANGSAKTGPRWTDTAAQNPKVGTARSPKREQKHTFK